MNQTSPTYDAFADDRAVPDARGQKIIDMAEAGYLSEQIGWELSIEAHVVRQLARKAKITIRADKRPRAYDPNRVLVNTIYLLDIHAGVDTIDFSQVDLEQTDELMEILDQYIAHLSDFYDQMLVVHAKH